MSRQIVIRKGDPRSPGATALLEASHTLMRALFTPEENHFLSVDDLCADDMLFFVAELDNAIAGCAALALKTDYAEVKSMFVDPAKRGAKLGKKLLDQLEIETRNRNLPVLRLETGDSLTAARKLYQAQGFAPRGPFGDYAANKTSIFMEKRL